MVIRVAAAKGVLAVQLCLALAVAGAGAAVAEPDEVAGCGRWSATTVASGYSMLENLAFDGRGGMLLSELALSSSGGAVHVLRADGTRAVVASVNHPGGLVVSGGTAYVAAGGDFTLGGPGKSDGAIEAIDLDSGAVSTVASGLTAPNGLARLPDGGFVVSRDIGSPTTLTRVARDGSGAHTLAPGLTSTNGLAYDPVRRKLFVSTTFESVTTLAAIDIDHPDTPPARSTVPGFGLLNAADDLTVGSDGNVYLALNVAGRIVRVDPDTGSTCTIADGLPFATSARFGSGPGWDPGSLYVTSFLGTVTRLTP
ncbi:SMP-30/gluconolactonase/LRE family protein [Nocardia sp. NPDC052566]|uniref:SMP-30/gluconolactonase/LRE family protein n=1 Tax=Nocardia sp. NPDC052566 TaxID=3364330 RepID=UPI0037C72602